MVGSNLGYTTGFSWSAIISPRECRNPSNRARPLHSKFFFNSTTFIILPFDANKYSSLSYYHVTVQHTSRPAALHTALLVSLILQRFASRKPFQAKTRGSSAALVQWQCTMWRHISCLSNKRTYFQSPTRTNKQGINEQELLEKQRSRVYYHFTACFIALRRQALTCDDVPFNCATFAEQSRRSIRHADKVYGVYYVTCLKARWTSVSTVHCAYSYFA